MRFKELYSDWQGSRLTQEEVARILGVHERTFRRYCRDYEQEGAEGLYDARLDKVAHNAASVDEVAELLNLFETNYQTFTSAHFYDMYRIHHKGRRNYNWVRLTLQEAGVVKKAKKRGVHRRKRERSPMKGMMIHQDSSTHEWVDGKKWDLIVTLDDASSEIYSGLFCEQEGTHSSFRGVKDTRENHGLICSIYTDRGSHYWTKKQATEKVDKQNPTQFKRAMDQLGIEVIAAYSPEASSRSERVFGTLQQRLPKEIALLDITDMDSANRCHLKL
jgi:transposase